MELAKVGQQVLEQGAKSGYGMTLCEIKFQRGEPVIMVHSHSQSLQFPGTEDITDWFRAIIETMAEAQYDGTRTFTMTFTKGKVGRILSDDYQNHIL